MITLRIDSKTHLGPLNELPAQVATQIKARLSFPNPAYLENEKRGFSTWNIPQEIQGFQVEGGALVTPGASVASLSGF